LNEEKLLNVHQLRIGIALTGAVALAALAAIACGGDDDDQPTSTATSAATTAAATATGSGSAGATRTVESTRPAGSSVELTNVSYDPTREFYAEYAEIFAEYYEERTGVKVTVNNSHGGSGSQARAILDGLEADVATLALSGDTDRLVPDLIESGWESEFAHNSTPYASTIVFLVRAGNPKGIEDWPDLAKEGVGVITPNPKTSGGARWNFLAAWGTVTENGGSEDEAKDLLSGIFANVLVLDSGARASTQTFVDRGIGDVLLAWENEALLSTRDSEDFEIVYPSQSILAEPAVAVVDSVVDDRETRDVATAFLAHLYDSEIQELIARHYYRPSDVEVLAKYRDTYPEFEKPYITIRDFGGWAEVQKKFFDDGAIFDQIYGQ
jgi:sulfate transport system substrate-binding protein